MELTIGVSCCKYPKSERLLPEWKNNVYSLISYVEQGQRGIRGFIKDQDGNPLKEAIIQVKKLGEDQSWRQKDVTSDSEFGRYWRILLPGNYSVRAAKDSSISEEKSVEISSNEYQRLDFVIAYTRLDGFLFK